MTKTMEDVIADSLAEWPAEDSAEEHAVRVAAALSAAGFGVVADQKRTLQLAALLAYDAVEEGALREAGAKALENAADDKMNGEMPWWVEDWLRSRAKTARGEG